MKEGRVHSIQEIGKIGHQGCKQGQYVKAANILSEQQWKHWEWRLLHHSNQLSSRTSYHSKGKKMQWEVARKSI